VSFFSIFDVAGSSLKAQNIRLNTVASNMANADSISSTAQGAYKARQPVFSSMYMNALGESDLRGVQVSNIVESQAPARKEYQPSHPMADSSGYIYFSNVNTMDEMANMIAASRSYQNSIEVLNTAKQLLTRTLTMGQ